MIVTARRIPVPEPMAPKIISIDMNHELDTHQICGNGECTDDKTTKICSDRNYTLQFFVHGTLTMPAHYHLLIL